MRIGACRHGICESSLETATTTLWNARDALGKPSEFLGALGILPGNHGNPPWNPRETPGNPPGKRGGTLGSLNHEIHFSWQAQYLVSLDYDTCCSAHCK